jgi:hypothetical protein
LCRDLSLAVGANGLNHTVHVTEKTRNVHRIQNGSVRKAGSTHPCDIIGSNLAGIARDFFAEAQEFLELRIDWRSAVIGHQRVRQIGIVEFLTEKLSVRLGSIETVVHA